MTCLHPNCSMISGGNTLEANARLNNHYINSNSLHVIVKWGSLDIIHYSIFYTFNTQCFNILNVLKVFFSINNKLKTFTFFSTLPEYSIELRVQTSDAHLAEVPVWVDDLRPLNLALALPSQVHGAALHLAPLYGGVGKKESTGDLVLEKIFLA